MRKQYYFRPSPSGLLAWDVDRLVRLSRELPVRTLPLTEIRELDEAVFGEPDAFRLDRDPAQNLLYGAGIHVCPGAPLARLEMRVFVEELLRKSASIATIPEKPPTLAKYPASGFSNLPLLVR